MIIFSKRNLSAGICACAVLSATSCRREAPDVGAAARACDAAPGEKSCVEWGRLVLDHFTSYPAEGESNRKRLAALAASLGSEELLGIQGAYTAKLGGLQAKNGDVVKAVELVEDGLGAMKKGLELKPGSKTLRIYYLATTARLPKVFKKRQETLESIASLRVHFALTDSEAKVVDAAQDRALRPAD